MTSSDIQQIQNTLEGIKNSLSSKWWENLLLVLAGALPTILLAWMGYKWGIKKDEKLFGLTQEKEERQIKAKLLGDIRVIEFKVFGTLNDFVYNNMRYNYWHRYSEACLDSKQMERASKYAKSAEQFGNQIGELDRKAMEEISKLVNYVAQYNYYAQDNKILDLLIEVEKINFSDGTIDFDSMDLPTIEAFDFEQFLKDGDKYFVDNFWNDIRNLTNYLMRDSTGH